MIKTSVALCTYNGARYLDQQLESFAGQTRLPDQVIVCDDASTDETVSILKRFAGRVPFAVEIHQNPHTIGSTRNFEQAISMCRGELIFLSDQDDVWHPRKIEKFVRRFDDDASASLFFSNGELVDENLDPLHKTIWDFTFDSAARRSAEQGGMLEVLLWNNAVTGAAAAFRSNYHDLIVPIPYDVPNLIHDGWIALVLASVSKIKYIDEPLLKYRIHGGQQLGLGAFTDGGLPPSDRFAISAKILEDDIKRLEHIRHLARTDERFKHRDLNTLIDTLAGRKKEMIKHYGVRRDLPRRKPARIVPVAAEYVSGRYSRFSKGILSAAKDIFADD